MSETLALYAVLMLVGVLPTLVWRMLGVFLARGVRDDSEFFVWVRAVATATLAAVVAKLAFMPSGALAEVGTMARAGGLLLAVIVYFLARRSVVAGVITGVAAATLAAFLKW